MAGAGRYPPRPRFSPAAQDGTCSRMERSESGISLGSCTTYPGFRGVRAIRRPDPVAPSGLRIRPTGGQNVCGSRTAGRWRPRPAVARAWSTIPHAVALRCPFQLDQATPDFSSSLYVILNICCVSLAHRARHCLGIFDESGERLQQGFAIVQENVPPHHRVACRDASEIAEPGGGEPQYFLAALCGQIIGGTADGEGD